MKEIEYHRLDRNREQDEKIYALLLERMKAADLARMLRANNLRVVETAEVPSVPIRPRVSLNVTLGLLVGLFLGLLLAWVREQLDSSIKTPEDLEQKLGVVFLGLLPEIDDRPENKKKRRRIVKDDPNALTAPELVVHARPLSAISEAARSVRTNIMFMDPDRPTRRLLVSSAAPAEGKTTVACSIAIAFAQSGQRVCLVDCDMRRPRIHRIFGRDGKLGVTSVLVGDATIDEVAKPTRRSAISGRDQRGTGRPPNPPGRYGFSPRGSASSWTTLGTASTEVIIDSPPLVAVTDAAIISTIADGTVFVVRAFATGKHVSSQGLRALRDVDAPIIGAVLNAVDLQRSEYTYYAYYNYKRVGYASVTPPVTPPVPMDEPPDHETSLPTEGTS